MGFNSGFKGLSRTGVLYVCRQDMTTAYCFIFSRQREREEERERQRPVSKSNHSHIHN